MLSISFVLCCLILCLVLCDFLLLFSHLFFSARQQTSTREKKTRNTKKLWQKWQRHVQNKGNYKIHATQKIAITRFDHKNEIYFCWLEMKLELAICENRSWNWQCWKASFRQSFYRAWILIPNTSCVELKPNYHNFSSDANANYYHHLKPFSQCLATLIHIFFFCR